MNFDKDIIKWIWFSQATVPGSSNASKILDYDDEIDELYKRSYNYNDYSVPDHVIDSLNDKCLDEAERILKYCEENDILPLHVFDRRFPDRLRNIQDHPALLYMKGTIPDFDKHVTIAVVGTRDCTDYGLETTYDICDGLARSGIIIVSGMALGIDAAAATAALNANKFTIAVLGCGVDVIYPPENESLYYQIKNNGLLVSEYPPLREVVKYAFPERNRIISGMSDGVFVVEAGKDSGALITADRALYQGRKIYAAPGNIDSPQSVGTNRLIQNGAKLIMDANDIIAEHQFDMSRELIPVMRHDVVRLSREKEERQRRRKEKRPLFKVEKRSKAEDKKHETEGHAVSHAQPELLSNKEKLIYNVLTEKPMSIDNIAKNAKIPIPEVSAMLTMLIIKQMVERHPGDRYTRTKKGK